MSNLCLNDNLVSEYLKYISNSNFDKNLLKKLLKYIQPFFFFINQHKIFLDPAFPMQINNDPLLKIIADCSEDDLVKATSLKIQLIENNPSKSFVELSINPLLANSEKLDMTLGATFENSIGKDKANKHIKDLLSDAKWIKITDNYIEYDSNQWNENKNILQNILPRLNIDIRIACGSFTKKNDLKTIYSDWNIKSENINQNIHDRYIETDKVKILLSSGLYNLSTNSQKDFTYMVKIK